MKHPSSLRLPLPPIPLHQPLRLLALVAIAAALVAVSPAAGPAGPAPGGAAPADAGKPAPLTIELDNVPSKLSLPADAGSNYFVTAVVRGAAPSRVWLARSEDARFGVTIPPFGDGHYQLNLADDRVVLALRRTGAGGQCYVFAKAPDGQVIQSAAVRFELSAPFAVFQVRQGEERANAASAHNWFRADKVTAVSVSVDPSLPGMTVQAEAGGKVWALRQKDETEFELAVTPEIAAAWDRNVELHVRCDPPLHQPAELTLRAIPTRLELPADGLTLTAKENSHVDIPGTRDFLSFQVGTVYTQQDGLGQTNGANVTLRHADDPAAGGGDPPVGEARVFRVGEQRFVWFVSATDRRPGGDFATLRVVQGPQAERQVLHTAFSQVGKIGRSCCNHCMTFNGKEYDASEAREQLEELYRRSGAGGVDDFLAAVRAREKEVGSSVRVVTGGNTDKPLAEWLGDSMREMGWDLP